MVSKICSGLPRPFCVMRGPEERTAPQASPPRWATNVVQRLVDGPRGRTRAAQHSPAPIEAFPQAEYRGWQEPGTPPSTCDSPNPYRPAERRSSPHPSPIRDFEFTLLVLDADWVAIPVVGRSALRSKGVRTVPGAFVAGSPGHIDLDCERRACAELGRRAGVRSMRYRGGQAIRAHAIAVLVAGSPAPRQRPWRRDRPGRTTATPDGP